METRKTIVLIGISIVLFLVITAFEIEKEKENSTSKSSFAVVELFTSEGCSSCPPADRLLSDLVDEARKQDKCIFALAFHVDYWNYLGWKDIYSDEAYSDRQRQYANALKTNRIYTPQMIVNGEEQFVGSDRSRAQSSIRKALGESAQTGIDIKVALGDHQKSVNVMYNLDSFPPNCVLNVALVEKNIIRKIKRGENRGLTLHHDNVVRSFKKMDIEKNSGEATLVVPKDVKPENSSVVAYIQNKNNMEILGAQGLDLKMD